MQVQINEINQNNLIQFFQKQPNDKSSIQITTIKRTEIETRLLSSSVPSAFDLLDYYSSRTL